LIEGDPDGPQEIEELSTKNKFKRIPGVSFPSAASSIRREGSRWEIKKM